MKLSHCLATYLEYGLMVRHSSRSIRHYNDWQVVTILRKGSCSTSHTEGFRKILKVFLAENGIHQLDNLILKKKVQEEQSHLTDSKHIAKLVSATRTRAGLHSSSNVVMIKGNVLRWYPTPCAVASGKLNT